MHSVNGTFMGHEVRVVWNDATGQYDGNPFVWNAVLHAARAPLSLTPTGPMLDRPNVHDEAHALALVSSVLRVAHVVGTVPPIPVGDDGPTPPDAVF